MAIVKPYISGNIQKDAKNNNPLKSKRILKRKCKLSGAKFLHLGGRFASLAVDVATGDK